MYFMTQIELSGIIKYCKCIKRKIICREKWIVGLEIENRVQADETNRISELKYLFGTKTKFEKRKGTGALVLPKKECVQLTNQDSA
jgi:hypothetical protein